MQSFADTKIIFWKYNADISFQRLNSYELNEAYENIEVAFEIPLSHFSLYLWDEQILRMDISVYENNSYSECFYEIENDGDCGALFFSFVNNNEILLNGLNRVIMITSEMQQYDDSEFIRFSPWARNNNYIYFRLSFYPTMADISIWDMPSSLGDINLLFNEKILYFFSISRVIQRGRININDFINEYNLILFPFFAP